MDSKIFISYSSQDKPYCDELLPALKAVTGIRERVWRDREEIDVGDPFHPTIQQALADSRLAILLVSANVLTSDYVIRHELPFLLRQYEGGALKLGIIYVSSVAKAALSVAVDGSTHPVDLTAIHNFNSPQQPLDRISERGERNLLYARVADWAARHMTPLSPPARQPSAARHDLAIFIEDRRDHWQHQFFPGPQAGAIKPRIDCPAPALTVDYGLDGEMLFQLLFGSEPATFTNLFALAFGSDRPVDPTYAPLRVRLLTRAGQLHRLPWSTIAYQGRRLSQAGWTVEFQNSGEPGFPEYPRHLCYFPGRVLLAASAQSGQAAHFDDLRRFFQRYWPDNPVPARAAPAADSLRHELQAGSTRLLYYYGPASRDGLLLQDRADGEILPWPDLASSLRQSRSVSLLFLNLVGDGGEEVLPQGSLLVESVKGAVLFQCNPRSTAHAAARAGLAWLEAVLVRKIDPVVALHQHASGQIGAWTRYSTWQIDAPKRLQNPDLVNLLLDRTHQRHALSGARDEFYSYPRRRIHHVVALGKPGCRTSEFPAMIRQHLVGNAREREVYYYQPLELPPGTRHAQDVDELARRRYRRTPHQPLLDALLDPAALAGMTFCFLILGWQASAAQGDAADVLNAVADWCRTRLAAELGADGWQAKVRVVSIVALESEHTDELAGTVERLIEECDSDVGFHFAELEALAAVRRQDLRAYFRNETICGCDDRYRETFPDLLLGSRKEMPFDEAVSTIRRGEPDNWGTLFEELRELTRSGAWPPPHYDPSFWRLRDAR